MSIVYTTTGPLSCAECGEPYETAAQLYACDTCGKVLCEMCLPDILPADCPNEFCEECVR